MHARYLESRLIQVATREGRASLANVTGPDPIRLPEADVSDMEYFIEQVRMILPVLGMDFLRPRLKDVATAKSNALVFELNSPKHGIHARAREADDEFFVLEGSLAQGQWIGADSEETSYARLQAKLLAAGKIVPDERGLARFVEDVPFKSPSAASAVILGRQDNGRSSWKVQGTKKTYGDWQNEQIEAASPETGP